MRAIAAVFVSLSFAAPAIALAQAGTAPDLNSTPPSIAKQPGGDTQANAEAAFRDASARCRKVTPAKQRRDCVAQAMREAEGAPRARTPSVEVRPAAPAASAASR